MSERQELPDIELVGIQFDGALGLDRTWLPLDQGLNVLYGLNGAGKSTVVREIRRLLSAASNEPCRHRMFVRCNHLAQQMRAVPEEQRCSEAIYAVLSAALEMEFGHTTLTGIDSDEPEYLLTPTLEFWDSLCTGYLCFTRSGERQGAYTVSVVIPLDDTLSWVSPKVAEALNKPSPLTDLFQNARRSYERGDDIVTGLGPRSDLSAQTRRLFESSEVEFQHWLAPLAPGPTVEDFEGLFGASIEPSERMNDEPDGAAEGAGYLRMWDIATIQQAPLGLVTPDDTDPAEQTASWIASQMTRARRQANRDGTQPRKREASAPASVPTSLLEQLTTAAQRRYSQLLVDAPQLLLARVSDIEALTGPAIQWRAYLDDQETTIPLSALSTAQSRWARIAIADTTHEYSDRVITLWVIDEPEAGLHRSAEAHMAAGLVAVSAKPGTPIIAATHSPMLLDNPSTNVVEVDRGPNGAVLKRLKGVDRSSMRSLGLQPSDLLNRVRTFLLVEGPHDRAVLEATVGDQLRAAGVNVVWVDGSKQMKAAIEGQFLCEFSDARLVAMVDNLDPNVVTDAWRAAKETLANEHDVRAAREALERVLPNGISTEITCIRQFLVRSLELGQESRAAVQAMSKPDIIMYLNPSDLLPTNEGWEELWAQFEQQLNSRNRSTNLKAWLTKQFGVEITTEAIAEAATKLDRVHPDFTRLVETCSR